jgi:SAM-dependent methyltransferase
VEGKKGITKYLRRISMVVNIIAAVQARLKEIYGPASYYSTNYCPEEAQYWGHIPAWMEQHLPTISKPVEILDIGPGYGTLAAVAVRLTGVAAMVMDRVTYIPNDVMREFHLVRYTDDVERGGMWPFLPGLDVVLMTEVLEHFNFHPLPTLRNIVKLMKDNGRLYLSTPDADSKWGRTGLYDSLDTIPAYDPAKHSYNNPEWRDGHIWQYTETELRVLIERAGLVPLRWDYSFSPGGRHFNVELTKRVVAE